MSEGIRAHAIVTMPLVYLSLPAHGRINQKRFEKSLWI